MATLGRFDPDLQMFVEQEREPNRAHLLFLRWLVEHGRLEHEIAGHAAGQMAAPIAVEED